MENEIESVKTIIDSGFDYVHVRKPSFSSAEMEAYLKKFPSEYLPHLKLNDHFELARQFDVAGLHLNRRNNEVPRWFTKKVSKSCHSFGELSNIGSFEYVFLSPIYDSICKQGYTSNFTAGELMQAGRDGLIDGKVIALGGITAGKLPEIKEYGFGGAAFLGYLSGASDKKELNERLKTIIKAI